MRTRDTSQELCILLYKNRPQKGEGPEFIHRSEVLERYISMKTGEAAEISQRLTQTFNNIIHVINARSRLHWAGQTLRYPRSLNIHQDYLCFSKSGIARLRKSFWQVESHEACRGKKVQFIPKTKASSASATRIEVQNNDPTCWSSASYSEVCFATWTVVFEGIIANSFTQSPTKSFLKAWGFRTSPCSKHLRHRRSKSRIENRPLEERTRRDALTCFSSLYKRCGASTEPTSFSCEDAGTLVTSLRLLARSCM